MHEILVSELWISPYGQVLKVMIINLIATDVVSQSDSLEDLAFKEQRSFSEQRCSRFEKRNCQGNNILIGNRK